jgi:Helix-turn-helix domain
MTGRLPLGRKVVDLAGEPRPYLTPAERAELVRSCPHPYDQTLDAIIGLAGRTGRLFASRERLEAVTKLSRRTVKRHRAWLVEAGYLKPQGGGHKGATARYLIARPAERTPTTVPPAWARIADPELRAEALRMEL